jgi:hypothetical protein
MQKEDKLCIAMFGGSLPEKVPASRTLKVQGVLQHVKGARPKPKASDCKITRHGQRR